MKIKNKYINKAYKLFTSRHFLLYTAIGLSGVALDFLIFALLISKTDINYLLANFIAISIAILNNFLLNAYFNFKKTDGLLYRFASFYFVGLLGLGLSQILLIFFIALGFNEIIAKLLTLPPILIFQFMLNKKYSFKSSATSNQNREIIKILRDNYLIVLLNVVFILISIFFIKTTPLAPPLGGPDESTHYKYNVAFIIQEKKLPISGNDDLEALSTCRDNHYGLVPCVYSYQIYPAFNYIFYALSGFIFHNAIGIEVVYGARLASLFWGLVYLNFVYLAVLRLSNNKKVSMAIASILSLIPQVVFIFSYINQDAHSLAFSAILAYTLVRLIQDKNRLSIILFCLALGGLLPLAKYNYFIYFPFLLILLIYFIWKKVLTNKQILALGIFTSLSFLLISSFWYIRNYLLYKDIFGQSYLLNKMSGYHALGTELPLFSISTLEKVVQLDFFESLFNSSIFALGYMNIWLKESVYTTISLVLVAALYLAIYYAFKTTPKHRAVAICLIVINIYL